MVTTFRQNFRNYLHLISAPIRFYQQCSGTFVKYPELCWPGNLFGSGFSGPGFGVSITIFVIKNTVVRCILVLYECLTYSSNRHFHAYLISHFEFEGLYLKKYTLLRVENAESLFAIFCRIDTVIFKSIGESKIFRLFSGSLKFFLDFKIGVKIYTLLTHAHAHICCVHYRT